jgi:phosphatidate cytidylyltransferase
VGVALGHGVLLREQPHGFALLVDVLAGTFIGDTAAHLVGSARGRHRLAAHISPGKTVEGLVAGIVVGTGAVLIAGLWQQWLATADALALGVAIAVAAPLGDLFESLVKRDAGVKDSGTAFGPHGGVLDRIDALLFSAPAAYYVSLVVL